VSVTLALDGTLGPTAAALARELMEIEEVVTVRVEPNAGIVVYRVDVSGGDRDLAQAPGESVARRLGLSSRVIEIAELPPRSGFGCDGSGRRAEC
jgi:hypothetical protein